MKKHLRKQFLRILNKILIIAAFLILLILLFGFLDDLMNKLDILIKHTGQQTMQIHNLENELHSLEVQNTYLENVVSEQHQQIQELRVNGNTITADLRPKEVIVPDDLHKEIPFKEVHKGLLNPQMLVATVLTSLSILRGTVGALLLP